MPTYLVGPTRTYTTISAAIAATPSDFTLPATGVHEIIVDAGTYNENPTFTRTADSFNYLVIRAADGAEHKGNINAGVIITWTTNAQAATISSITTHAIFKNLVIKNISSGGVNSPAFCVSYGNSHTFQNCIAVKDGYGYGFNSGFGDASSESARSFFYCCLAISIFSTLPSGNHSGFSATSASHLVTLYNCGAYGFLKSFDYNTFSISVKVINCWAARRAGGTDFVGAFTSSTNNASTDSTAPGSNALVNKSLSQYAFVSVAGNNFHITTQSILSGSGSNQSSAFTTDWDVELITNWPIGPDAQTASDTLVVSGSSTAAQPGVSRSRTDKQKDAQAPSLNKQSSEKSPKLQSSPIPPELKASTQQIYKGYKDGFIAIIPENGGYMGSTNLGTGNKVGFVRDNLSTGKSFSEPPFISPSRAIKERKSLSPEPNGGFSFPLRSNDCIPTFMSHFQNRYGTTPSVGTAYYEFYPAKQSRLLSGSNFGTGSYFGTTQSAFPVSVFKSVAGSAYHFKSGLCDKLTISVRSNDEAMVDADFKFGTYSIVGTNSIPNLGSYSRLSNYPSWASSINFLGLDVIDLEIQCLNNLRSVQPVGTHSRFYQFGKHQVKGKVAVDVPKQSLAYIGSMLGGSSFSVYGTFFNNNADKIIYQMPNCMLDPFELRVGEHDTRLSFQAYESEDGLTPSIKFMMWTQNYSATSFQPN
jgi:hypothetical protein